MIKKTFLTLAVSILSALSVSAQESTCDPGLFCSIGAIYHGPRTDYVSKFGGLDLGMTVFSSRGNVYIADCVFGGGEARKDFKTSEGMILKNDDLVHSQFQLGFGHVAHQTERTKLFPFVCMGVSGYEFIYDDEEDIRFDKYGFCSSVGVQYNIRLSHNNTIFEHLISIKPYASVSFYNDPLHVVPSFNLSVAWNFGGTF